MDSNVARVAQTEAGAEGIKSRRVRTCANLRDFAAT
jgi:hypothetical protein